MLLFKSPAKINLHLRVLGKRNDGYHEVATLLHTIDLADEMSFSPAAEGIYLSTAGLSLPAVRDNIIFKAAALMIEEFQKDKGVHITLNKKIPVAAGLGGGSSNAAMTLMALDELWNLDLGLDRLSVLAARLGSDVPFFIRGPAAVGRGRGEILTPAKALGGLPLVLVVPDFQVTAEWAYSNLNLELTKTGDDISMIQTAINSRKSMQWTHLLRNDLEQVVIKRFPIIEQIKNRLLELGAAGALMTGSGPVVFGLFIKESVAKQAADTLEREGKTVVTTKTSGEI